jgi:beta-glucosidase
VPKDRGEDEVIRLYTMGMNAEVLRDLRWNAFTVVSGDYDASKDETRPTVPENTDYAIIRVNVSNDGARQDLFFGGPNPEELNILAFSDMAKAKSWKITPSLADIQAVMNEARADKTILSIYFRQPFVLDEKSGLRKAGAILATFGVGDVAILDVLTGKHNPTGKLPFSLANNAEAVKTQDSDAPGYRKKDTLFPFGHGLTY